MKIHACACKTDMNMTLTWEPPSCSCQWEGNETGERKAKGERKQDPGQGQVAGGRPRGKKGNKLKKANPNPNPNT